MKISTIFALTNTANGESAFGHDNKLVTYNRLDMVNFKEVTTNVEDCNMNTLIMGRKTFESMGSKTLPNRHTVVVTSVEIKNVTTARSLQDAIWVARNVNESPECFIIGGVKLIEEAINKYATTAHVTTFNINNFIVPECDTMFINSMIFSDLGVWYEYATEFHEQEMCTVLGGSATCDMTFKHLLKMCDK